MDTGPRTGRLGKAVRWIAGLAAVGLCAVTLYAGLWVRQYQQLADDEPQVVLAPDVPDLTYCTPDGLPLKLDLYFPERADGPYPLLVYVHGGSFTSGDKRTGSGIVDIPAMTARGYAVATVNYRLMPDHPFPAEVVDAKCAIRFLRAHAREYGLAVDAVGIWGGSAGGHLAAMVGLTNDDPAFDSAEYADQSSRVAAVVDMFGPTDLTLSMDWLQRSLLRRAFGTDQPDSPLLRAASPVNYVTGAAPPFLILQGAVDTAVPVGQSQALYDRLTQAGVEVTLVIVENANHNFKPTGGSINPSRSEISGAMGEFFDRTLR